MTQKRLKWLVVPGLMLGVVAALTALGLRPANAVPVSPVVSASQNQPASVVAPQFSANPALLDARRREALGMIETGNHDNEIGGAGEVSRYQIMPSVWKQYSESRQYQNPQVSLSVAQQHWTKLYAGFQKQAHRDPSDFDMYVLWNTHYGYYAGKGFDPARLSAAVRDRAQRFVNLVQYADF